MVRWTVFYLRWVILTCNVQICRLLLWDRERRDMAGDKPPDLSGFCGANVDGTLYVFAGCHNNRYTNEVGDV